MAQLHFDAVEMVQKALENLDNDRGALIPLLQSVQAELGYISPQAVSAIADALGVAESHVYGAATFYSEFHLNIPGQNCIKVCMGTSCYLSGGPSILERLTRSLGIKPGQTSRDGKFSLERVACLGCCSRSPVIQVNDLVYGNLSPSDVDQILTEIEERA
ncbi:MAG: NADH-quinone oxidoreductase subunit NuoE [Methanosarcinales archaeon]|nr:NADH-quinone oxidoreductase subunit NuoE [Methanosarcinales archaeon]